MELTCRLLLSSFRLKHFLILGVRRRDGKKRKPRLRGNQDIPWPPQEPQQVNGQVGTFPPVPPGSGLAPSKITISSISPPPNVSAFQITLCCLTFMAFYTQKSQEFISTRLKNRVSIKWPISWSPSTSAGRGLTAPGGGLFQQVGCAIIIRIATAGKESRGQNAESVASHLVT